MQLLDWCSQPGNKNTSRRFKFFGISTGFESLRKSPTKQTVCSRPPLPPQLSTVVSCSRHPARYRRQLSPALEIRHRHIADRSVYIRRSTLLGNRAFAVAAAREWNSLPSSVMRAPSLNTFKHSLKSSLFTRCFP